MPYSYIKTSLYILSIAIFSSASFGSDAYFYKADKSYSYQTEKNSPYKAERFYSYNKEKNVSAQKSNRLLLASNELISADQAANIAKRGKNSKVLKISKKTEGNREFYRVKLLTPNGHVRIVLVDARSGEIVNGNK